MTPAPDELAAIKSPLHKDGCPCKVCNSIRARVAAGRPSKGELEAARTARREARKKALEAKRDSVIRREIVKANIAHQIKNGEAPNVKKAMEIAGYSENSINNGNFRNEIARRSIDKAFLSAGVTDERLAAVHAEGLAATQVKIASHEGMITDEREYVDHNARHKFLETAYKVKGILKDDDPSGAGGLILIGVKTEVVAGHDPICQCDECNAAWTERASSIRRDAAHRSNVVEKIIPSNRD
jgi:hypothetical protein